MMNHVKNMFSEKRYQPIMLHKKCQLTLHEIVKYIVRYPDEPNTVEYLCQRFQVAAELLAVPFEHEFNISLADFVKQAKMTGVPVI
jgi:hypothetical protein